jgi:peptidoglycan-N-acetylglucosamine deacetylase
LNPWPAVVSTGAAVAAGVGAWGAVVPSSELFGPTLRHTDDPGKIALTFDDGPNPAVTPRLLELFDRYSVRATFFLIGKFARACPELVREISARGHVIGNHTDTHPSLIFESRTEIRDELSRCQDAIHAATHAEPPLWMRPPYGYRSPLLQREIRRASMRGVVMWSKICWDWKPQPPQRLIERLSRVARSGRPHGDIVVLHDGDHRALGGERAHVLASLEHWIPRWHDLGREFVTMDSMSPTV